MAITIDGTDGISPLKASGQTQTTTGTAAAPAISSSSDTDSGIFFGTNEVKFSTGGTQRATFDSSGHLGLGTTSPTDTGGYGRALDIQSDSGAAIYLRTNDDTSQIAQGASDLTIRTRQAHPIIFNTNNAERARLDSSGRLMLGTTTEGFADTADNLTIADTANCGITIRSGTSSVGSIYFSDGTSGSSEYEGYIDYQHNGNYMRFGTSGGNERVRIDNTGRTIMLGTSTNGTLVAETTQGAASNKNIIVGGHSATSIDSGTGCFVVLSNGNVVNTNNSYGAISDVKLKENIVDASSQWDDIKAVQVRNYNLKQSTGQQTHTQLGVVAQEIEAVSPGLVSDSPDLDADGNDLGTVTKSVNYSVLYMKAVKALQEAQTRIETLETQNADLLARVTALEAA